MTRTNGTMKRTSFNGKDETVQLLSAIASRLELASKLGFSHDGQRDLYKTLGYPKRITSKDLIAQWRRQDIARAVVDRPAKLTWKGDLSITEPNDEEQTELEKKYNELEENLSLKNKFLRVDKLAQLGKYAVLLLGFDDSSQDTWAQPVSEGERVLKYVKPISQDNAKIKTWEKEASDERYGKPRIYEIQFENPGVDQGTTSLKVHHSRILHVAFELLEDEVEGEPIMVAIYNRLKDLEKLIGGSAEMFWRGARPGYTGSAKENYSMGDDIENDLKTQLTEYEHDLRRFIVAEGVDLKALATQISDPKGHVNVQLQMVSAVSNIPLRILTGSERGELASNQDDNTWKEWVQSRREETAETAIVRPFINRMLKYGVLPEPQDTDLGYSVLWSDLTAMNGPERADIGNKQSEALSKYAKEPYSEQLIPLEAFLKFFLNMDEDTVKQIIEMRDAQELEMIAEEDDLESDLPLLEEEEMEEEADV